MKKTSSQKGGFTLIETLVAITLLLLAVGGPLYAVSQSLSSAIYARDQVTAFYLAQDAVEYIRNIRDNNALSNNSWLTHLDYTTGSSFTIDTTNSDASSAIQTCSGACPALSYHESSGIYDYKSGTVSPYTRTITMSTVDSALPVHEIQLKVAVSWKVTIAGARKDFTVTENLTSWVQ